MGRVPWLACVERAVSAQGVISGLGVGAASAKDQPRAQALFFARHTGDPRWCSALVPRGCAGGQCLRDVLDKGFSGFSGAALHQQSGARARALWCPGGLCAPARLPGPTSLAQSLAKVAGGSAPDRPERAGQTGQRLWFGSGTPPCVRRLFRPAVGEGGVAQLLCLAQQATRPAAAQAAAGLCRPAGLVDRHAHTHTQLTPNV